MAAQKDITFNLASTFVQLSAGPSALLLPGGREFWSQLHQRADWQEGRLVMVGHQNADWTNWEMHPAGDEFLYLLSGEMDLVLDEASGERSVKLQAGDGFVVPQGVWHTASVCDAGDLLSITRGSGTQHRALKKK